jgi:MGT family glycosyltransferase
MSTKQARVLMVAQPSVGHVTGLLTVGRRLLALGADVRFALPSTTLPLGKIPLLPSMLATALAFPETVTRAGMRFVPMPARLEMMAYAAVMPFTSGLSEMRLAARMLTAALVPTVRYLEAVLEREPADVVVSDFGVLATYLAGERLGVPVVTFFHAGLPFPSAGVYPYTGGEEFSRAIDVRLHQAREALGLPRIPPGFFDTPYSRDLNLLATTPTMEGRADEAYPRTHWVGACVDGRVEEDDFPFEKLRPDALKVYVSLGTVFNTHPERFRTLIAGLVGPGVQLVVNAGASFEALQPLQSSDVLVFRRVPQVRLLRAVDCIVSHGGNNTVNEALSAGVPLLVLPIGGEQEANAKRVERLGAGIALHRDTLTPTSVRSAFEKLRASPSYKQHAERIAKSTEGLNGAAEAARLILELVEQRRHEQA